MAAYRQLPSGLWNVQLRIKGHKPKSASFPSRAEAEQWAKEEQSRIKNTGPITTFYELGESLCSVGFRGKATQHESFLMLNRICREFKLLSIPMDINKITQQHINEYRLYRLQHVANATCRKDLSLISRIFKWGKREYLLDIVSPVEGVNMPPPSKPRTRIVERSELDKLLEALTPIMATVVELAYETAMRRAEIVKLTPHDLHLDERYLNVINGKTGDRPVPLTMRAVEILREAQKTCLTSKARIFPITAHSVSTAFRRARKAVGLDNDICLHQLRHTRITMVARKGFNQAQIMMVSGHRDSRSVQRYTHLNVSDVVDLLD
ncbi:MAG: site-specific integrase [Rhodospirillales bacterium]|nr:site-specific integrase [Rhodospirillales bacterium]